MQNTTQTFFSRQCYSGKVMLQWEVTNLHEKNMWPHQGFHRGLGISPGYCEHDPQLLSYRKQKENGTKRTS